MRPLRFALVALFFAAPTLAQTATVTGKITNVQGKPLVNYTVSVGGKLGFTDIRGVYRIRNVPWASQVLMQIKKDGKVLKETRIDVSGSSVARDIKVP